MPGLTAVTVWKCAPTIQAFVTSRLDYCSALHMRLHLKTVCKLQPGAAGGCLVCKYSVLQKARNACVMVSALVTCELTDRFNNAGFK